MTEQELTAAREIANAIRACESDLATFRMSMVRLVPIRDGQPKGHKTDSQVEKIAVLITDKEREIEELRTRLMDTAGALARKISQADLTPQERRVMFLRYVACDNFRDIAFQMDKSDARVYSIHATALDKILTKQE